MLVRFWGVRGSVPWSLGAAGAAGCNTPCVEVRNEDTNEALVLDAGTGIVGLGRALAAERAATTILLTHFHWDHIEGLPFFAPLFEAGANVSIVAPALGSDRGAIEAILNPPYFPVGFANLPARPAIRFVEPGEIEAGGFQVRAAPLHHPGGAFAYRITGAAGDLVYISDHEFGNPAVDEPLAPFAVNSGATVLDAHFTPEELPSHAGWGHATWQQSTEFASATGAGHLWLFHHKPGRTDEELRAIEARARRVYPATRVAREGDVFKLSRS